MFYLIHWRDLGHPIRSSCGLFTDKVEVEAEEAVSEAEGDGGGVSEAGATRTIERFSE